MMMEAGPTDTPQAWLQALRAEGVHQLDPVRLHYIEALAARASTYQGSVRRVLDAKLAAAVAALRASVAQDAQAAQGITTLATPTAPETRGETLGDLVRHMAAHALDKPDAHTTAAASAPTRTELKSVAYFRNTWSKLSVEKQVAQALEQAPKNAGPINSHMVALRALALMRDTAPDYLNRFTSYVDTLLSLDPAERVPAPAARPPRAAKPKLKS